MDTNEKKSTGKANKIIIAVMALIIMVLVWQLIVTKTKVNTFTIEKEKTQSKNQMLQHELDSLLTEHNKIKNEYSTLSGQLKEKDSLILANAEEIQKLIETKADYNRIKRKLDYLRGITQGYVSQIDSLFKVNKVLKDENVEIKDKFEKEQEKTVELTKDKKQLSEKVNLASTLKAYNIKGIPLRLKSGGKKEEITDKAKKAERIKITFTLSENLIVSNGDKSVYLRLVLPNEKVISSGDANTFEYNGENIVYTVKQNIDYRNEAMDLSMYWDKTQELIPGTYVASLFVDGYLIGESQFQLK